MLNIMEERFPKYLIEEVNRSDCFWWHGWKLIANKYGFVQQKGEQAMDSENW